MFLYTYRFLYRFYGLILVSVVRVLPSSNIKHLFIIFMPSPLSLWRVKRPIVVCRIPYDTEHGICQICIDYSPPRRARVSEWIYMKEYTRTDNVESIHTYVNSCDKHTLDDAQQWKIYTMRQFEIGAELDFFSVFSLVAVVAKCFNPKTWSYVERQRDSEIMMILDHSENFHRKLENPSWASAEREWDMRWEHEMNIE